MLDRVLSVLLYVGAIALCQPCIWAQAANDMVANGTDALEGIDGFAVIISKLNYLQHKLLELNLGTREHTEELMQSNENLEAVFRKLLWSIGQLDQAVSYNLSTIQDQSRKILLQQIACANHERMRTEISRLALNPPASDSSLDVSEHTSDSPPGPYRSCKEVPLKVSGKYLIRPGVGGTEEPFVAFCEQVSFGGGWMMVQRRLDGKVNFNRFWDAYRVGFGSVDGEYWMGLERMHQLTSARTVELMVEVEDFEGNYGYARYSKFVVGNEQEQYQLKELGQYRGTAGDSLTTHLGMKFSTADRGNDAKDGNCARRYGGGWWFYKCHPSNLNGNYLNQKDWIAIIWRTLNDTNQGLSYTRMMIREV